MSEIYTKSLTIGGTTIKGLPPVTTADNEKVLGVVNGQWAVVEPESFEVTEKSWTKSLDFGSGDTYTPLMVVTTSDNGKILTVVNGEWAAVKPPTKIVTWADGTDEEIAAMVAAADAGEINLADYWSVGDERTIQLSAMAATGVSERHTAQEATLVLMNVGGKTLAEATESGRTTCSFIVGLKNSLAEIGYMNNSNTNSGSWNSSARRAWCNSVFREAIPSTIRGIFKQHKNLTAATYNGSTNQETIDYFALPAEKEVFGSRTYSNTTEANALSQFTYYATTLNRVKKLGNSGSASTWWERSPYSSYSHYFCTVASDGSAGYFSASYTDGVAPFGVI